jgi:hypothetical protein
MTDDKTEELMQQLAPSWNLLYVLFHMAADDAGIIDSEEYGRIRLPRSKMPSNSTEERYHPATQC